MKNNLPVKSGSGVFFFRRLLTAVGIGLLAITFSPKTTSAHDAGMSSLGAEFSGGTLTVTSNYSASEIRKIAAPEDEKQMAVLAAGAVVLSADGREAGPAESSFTVNQGHDVIFRQVFSGISGNRIDLRSALISKLGPEHRQYLTVVRADGEVTVREILNAGDDSVAVDFEKLEPDASFAKFLLLGIEHILFGYDHLLFLLALLLAVKSFGETVGIVTSFTLAHSITLSLAALDLVEVSSRFVEPLIALSIVFVGLENLFKIERKTRWAPAYFFGLLHGLGFASALREAGIGNGFGVAVPLLSFNLGVEIGQIAACLMVLPILWKLGRKNRPIYTTRLVPAASCLVILAGIYWLIERTFF